MNRYYESFNGTHQIRLDRVYDSIWLLFSIWDEYQSIWRECQPIEKRFFVSADYKEVFPASLFHEQNSDRLTRN